MSPKISVLIPSRGRLDGLMRSVNSVWSSCVRAELVEILVRKDDDDRSYDGWEPAINARFISGSRPFRGYNDLYLLYTELDREARGDWVFIMNDDAIVEGHGWDARLPEHDAIVQFDIPGGRWRFEAGQGMVQGHGGCFPIVPRGIHKKLGFSNMGDSENPVDVWLDVEMRLKRGYPSVILDGCFIRHERVG